MQIGRSRTPTIPITFPDHRPARVIRRNPTTNSRAECQKPDRWIGAKSHSAAGCRRRFQARIKSPGDPDQGHEMTPPAVGKRDRSCPDTNGRSSERRPNQQRQTERERRRRRGRFHSHERKRKRGGESASGEVGAAARVRAAAPCARPSPSPPVRSSRAGREGGGRGGREGRGGEGRRESRAARRMRGGEGRRGIF